MREHETRPDDCDAAFLCFAVMVAMAAAGMVVGVFL